MPAVHLDRDSDRDSFRKSLLDSQLCGGTDTLSTMSPSALFDLYDGTLRRIVDEHLPVEEVSVRDRPLTPWFDNVCRAAKRKVRMLERRFRRTHSAMDCMAWVRQLERKRDLLERKEERYWNEKIASNAGKPKKLWSLLNSLQQKDRANQPPASDGISAESLSNFFRDKVEKVRDETSTADPPTFTKLQASILGKGRAASGESGRVRLFVDNRGSGRVNVSPGRVQEKLPVDNSASNHYCTWPLLINFIPNTLTELQKIISASEI